MLKFLRSAAIVLEMTLFVFALRVQLERER